MEEDFDCPVCQEVLRMPVRTKNCQHVFCRSCLEIALRTRGPHCPLCRGPVAETARRATDVQQRMRTRKGTCRACGTEKFFSKMRLHYKTCRKYIEEYGPITNATQSTPANIPVQIPVQTPVQIPVQTPVQTLVQIPVQTLVQIPVQTLVHTPVQTLVHTPVQIPVQTPVQIPVQTPVVLPCSGLHYVTLPAHSNSGRRVYSCPYCPLVGLIDIALVQHCVSQHSAETAPTVCPICEQLPWGNPGYCSRNLIGHMRQRHRFSYAGFMNEEEEEDVQLCRALHMSVQDF